MSTLLLVSTLLLLVSFWFLWKAENKPTAKVQNTMYFTNKDFNLNIGWNQKKVGYYPLQANISHEVQKFILISNESEYRNYLNDVYNRLTYKEIESISKTFFVNNRQINQTFLFLKEIKARDNRDFKANPHLKPDYYNI